MTIIIDANGCDERFHEMHKTAGEPWTVKHGDGSKCDLIEFKVKQDDDE